jgi:hypothetical protein
MADHSKKLSKVINVFISNKNTMVRCLDTCMTELEQLYDTFEQLDKMKNENKQLHIQINKQETELDQLRSSNLNFNNVSMLKQQDRQICELTKQMEVLEKQVKYYKDQSQTNSDLGEKIELYVDNHINSLDILNENDNTPADDTPLEDTPLEDTPLEDTPLDNTTADDTPLEDNTPLDDTKNKNTKKSDKKSSKSDKKSDKKSSKSDKSNKNDISNKLTEEEENDLEMIEDSNNVDYYLHRETKRIFSILDDEGNIGDLVGTFKKGKICKFT